MSKWYSIDDYMQLPSGYHSPERIQLWNWIRKPFPMMKKAHAKWGDTFTCRFPFADPIVFLSNPKDIKEVFTGDPNVFYSGVANSFLKPSLGDSSVLVIDGEKHNRIRKVVLTPFHGSKMASYRSIIQRITEKEISNWPENQPFSLHATTQSIALKVIIETVFGLSQGETFEKLEKLLIEILDIFSNPYSLFFVNKKGEPYFEKYLSLFGPLNPIGHIQKKLNEIDKILYPVIEESKSNRDQNRQDILAKLMNMKDEQGSHLSKEEIRDQLMTLLVAGHETTATALCWVMYRLCKHPEITKKVLEEMESPDSKQKYLKAVIDETLRINPIIPLVVRQLQKEISLNGRTYQKGTILGPCIYLVHHNSKIWKNPSEFNPDRFLNQTIPQEHFFPFGGGHRYCIGAAFSYLEMLNVLPVILKNYRLKLADGYKMKVTRRSISFAPSKGLMVTAKKL